MSTCLERPTSDAPRGRTSRCAVILCPVRPARGLYRPKLCVWIVRAMQIRNSIKQAMFLHKVQFPFRVL